MFPTILVNDDGTNGITIQNKIKNNRDIKNKDVVKKILQSTLLRIIPESRIMGIKPARGGWRNTEPREIFSYYTQAIAKENPSIITENRAKLDTPPNLSQPFDMYIHKQEKCQERAKRWGAEIDDSEIERVTHEHMGVSGAVNDKYLEYDRIYRSGKGDWQQCKSFYWEALEDKKALANLQAANSFSNLDTKHQDNQVQVNSFNNFVQDDVLAMSGQSKMNSTTTMFMLCNFMVHLSTT